MTDLSGLATCVRQEIDRVRPEAEAGAGENHRPAMSPRLRPAAATRNASRVAVCAGIKSRVVSGAFNGIDAARQGGPRQARNVIAYRAWKNQWRPSSPSKASAP
jgi:hypothetical protein